MQLGTVKWFSENKGYGFIRPQDGTEDVFVFYPSIEAEGYKRLSHGQTVHFETSRTERGLHTTRVVPVVQ